MFASKLRWAVGFALVTGVSTSCASRAAPAGHQNGAASSSAGEAPVAVVTRSLENDPPLPGTPTEGWSGLAPKAGGPAPVHSGHHVHQHGASGTDSGKPGDDPPPGEQPPSPDAHDQGDDHAH